LALILVNVSHEVEDFGGLQDQTICGVCIGYVVTGGLWLVFDGKIGGFGSLTYLALGGHPIPLSAEVRTCLRNTPRLGRPFLTPCLCANA